MNCHMPTADTRERAVVLYSDSISGKYASSCGMSRASSLAVIIGKYFSPRFIAAEKSFLAVVVNRLTQLSTLGLAMFAMSHAGAAGAALGSDALTGVEIASAACGS